MRHYPNFLTALFLASFLGATPQTNQKHVQPGTTQVDSPERMDWWREAKFGMFIHWGLYAIPAGEWGGGTGYGEWILNSAKIPVSEYENFKGQFNPTKFSADDWAKMAVDAGFKYIVITTKHHDGFALFDSKLSDWGVASTPFKRDVIKELADACAKRGIRLGFYHSIMDWHHPDYLPRRPWENRSAEGANFENYIAYMKGQLKELLTNYGPISVLWYDGQWESTWTHEMGLDLYSYTRSLQPQIIVNNRVDKGGGSMQMTVNNSFAGDYGTPEQEVPPMGLPGVDWETCMTMNDNWGYNKADHNWKSSTELIRTLIDVASKGGNLLLNVGPTALGEFPKESIERLADIGRWMKIYGESIYGTQANPFPNLDFGRCTQRKTNNGDTLLYFHVFDWPKDGRLAIPGLNSKVRKAYLLNESNKKLKVTQSKGETMISVPVDTPNTQVSVVAVEISGRPDIALPPVIKSATPIFHEDLDILISSGSDSVNLHYSLDGSEPTSDHPIAKNGKITIDKSSTVKVRAFRGRTAFSPSSEATFQKVTPQPAIEQENLERGLLWEYFEGDFKSCEEMNEPIATGQSANFSLRLAKREEHFGLRFQGYIVIPTTGVYTFHTTSDDGSALWIDGAKIVDNDGLHGPKEKSGIVALEKGLHTIRLDYFQATGGAELIVHWHGRDVPRKQIGDNFLMRKNTEK
ncbi:MAG: alpha-L-fucosidase [Holophagales bacterium]|nr:alpha-L-fucosidase [Holophagales bacterium]